mmetsp:Transcript_11568/g.19398  ORF Transcript_11568/g.19398 Transcript_11568/m.19398 type:complete len:123 (+) Transcript_11568:390-758(+)
MLGEKSLLSQPLHTWNPFKLYSDYKVLSSRLKDKKLDGNLKGEGLLKGGLFIISPTEGIVFQHQETTGTCMPYDEIERVVASLGVGGATGSKDTGAATATLKAEGDDAAETCKDTKTSADQA